MPGPSIVPVTPPTTSRRYGLAFMTLVLTNLIPLAGYIWLGWELYDLMILYWLESAVVGLFTVARMLTAKQGGFPLWLHAAVLLFVIPFFLVHYGAFWVGHGLFLGLMFGPGGPTGVTQMPPGSGPLAFVQALVLANLIHFDALKWPLLGMMLSHASAFVSDYLQVPSERSMPVPTLMAFPYSRVFVLHFTIILAGFVAMTVGPSIGVVAIFVAIKIIVDARAHFREHDLAMRRAATNKIDAPMSEGAPA